MALPLTEDEKSIIRRACADGLTMAETVVKLSDQGYSRTRCAISGFAHRDGLSFGAVAGAVRKTSVATAPAAAPTARPAAVRPIADHPRPLGLPFTPKPAPASAPKARPARTAPRDEGLDDSHRRPFVAGEGEPPFIPSPGQCRFPHGEARHGTLEWCCAPVWREGATYCSHHHARTHTKKETAL